MKNQSLLNLLINAPRIIKNHPTSSHYYQKNSFTIGNYFNHINLSKTIIILHFMNIFGKEYLNINKQNDYVTISIHNNRYTNTKHENLFSKKAEELLRIEENFISEEEEKNIKISLIKISMKKY